MICDENQAIQFSDNGVQEQDMGKATLIIVLGYIIIFGLMLKQMANISERSSSTTSELYENMMARQITSSALEYMVSWNVQNRTTDTTITSSDWIGGSFNAAMALQGSDPSTSTDTVTVNVYGLFNGVADTARATFLSESAITLQMPVITAAFAFYSPNATLIMRAQSEINGNDMNMDGTPGPGTAIPGITATGAISVTMNAGAVIDGAPPSPSPGAATGTWEELSDLADSYLLAADYIYLGDQVIAGASYGSAANPVIVYFNEDCKFTAATTGYGILVVRGDLLVTSHFQWYGLVVVSGNTSCEVEEDAHSIIYGALLIGAQAATGDVKSHSAVQYSTDALDMVMNALISTGGGSTSRGPRRIADIQWWE